MNKGVKTLFLCLNRLQIPTTLDIRFILHEWIDAYKCKNCDCVYSLSKVKRANQHSCNACKFYSACNMGDCHVSNWICNCGAAYCPDCQEDEIRFCDYCGQLMGCQTCVQTWLVCFLCKKRSCGECERETCEYCDEAFLKCKRNKNAKL